MPEVFEGMRSIPVQTIPDPEPRPDDSVWYTILDSSSGQCASLAPNRLMCVWTFSMVIGQYAQLPRGRKTLVTWRPQCISSANISRASVSPYVTARSRRDTVSTARLAELQRIPFGTTLTYRALAERLGMPQAARAVGHANGCNPLAILIPCHRLIGSDGQLRGYASGCPETTPLRARRRPTLALSSLVSPAWKRLGRMRQPRMQKAAEAIFLSHGGYTLHVL